MMAGEIASSPSLDRTGVEVLRILRTSDVEWGAFLARASHDFYHLPAYLDLCAKRVGGEALAVHVASARAELFLPLVKRPVPNDVVEGWFDVASPYGYAGPLFRFDEKANARTREQFIVQALEKACEELRQRRVLTAFVRLHPLLSVPVEPFARVGQLVLHGRTVAIDLTQSEAEMWHQTRPNHRRGVNGGERLGHAVLHDTSWSRLNEFVGIYRETMHRVRAAAHYHFDVRYFEELKNALGSERAHLFMVLDGDLAIGGAVFTEVDGIVQFHLGGTPSESLALHPHKLLHTSVARWAKSRGDRVLHLGGGVAGFEDSLYHFKAGFSQVRWPFYTWRRVLEPRVWASVAPEAAVAPDEASFFPAYRRRHVEI